MTEEQEKALEELMESLKNQLEQYRKINLDYYLKTIGEIEKIIKSYNSRDEKN